MKRLTLAVLAVLALSQGCQGCLGCTSPIDQPNSTLPRTCLTEPPLIEPQKLDILFVIDNSNSMREQQEAVARELTAFVDEIKQAGGVRQDFNVGVITTSVYQHSDVAGLVFLRGYPGQEGALRPVPDALADGGVDPNTGTERLLSGEDPDLISKFGRLVQQGTGGSGQETPFEAIHRALLTDLAQRPLAQGGNGGFLRDGARLLIVLLTDEDDCSETAWPPVVTVSDNPAVADCTDKANSLTPVSEYHRLFTETLQDGLGNKREVIFTSIAPVGVDTKAAQAVLDGNQVRNIDCPTSNQAGLRIRQMAEMFDSTLVNLDSICRPSFRDTLVAIAELASVSQVLELRNVPDPRMLQVTLTRKDGTAQLCTTQQGIVGFTEGTTEKPARIQFGNECKRRADDQAVGIKMLCAI